MELGVGIHQIALVGDDGNDWALQGIVAYWRPPLMPRRLCDGAHISGIALRWPWRSEGVAIRYLRVRGKCRQLCRDGWRGRTPFQQLCLLTATE